MRSWNIVVIATGLVVGSCGGADSTETKPTETFIPFASTFGSFRTWTSFHSDGPAAGTFPPDVLGPRTQYVNELPPKGSTKFPVGTVIVEARESGAKNIFAAVKRGGDYNPTGARDWEWFELKENDGGPVTIVWRGVGPPIGETYGGDATGGCNACHATCADNDYICGAKLRVGSF
jgi:hypothetical protein